MGGGAIVAIAVAEGAGVSIGAVVGGTRVAMAVRVGRAVAMGCSVGGANVGEFVSEAVIVGVLGRPVGTKRSTIAVGR